MKSCQVFLLLMVRHIDLTLFLLPNCFSSITQKREKTFPSNLMTFPLISGSQSPPPPKKKNGKMLKTPNFTYLNTFYRSTKIKTAIRAEKLPPPPPHVKFQSNRTKDIFILWLRYHTAGELNTHGEGADFTRPL